jgi:hypothetical protein
LYVFFLRFASRARARRRVASGAAAPEAARA